MSWFDKKEENQNPEIPKLPELPRLSEIQEEGEEEEIEDSPKQIHQLPSFPHNSLGDKFSQNTIKEAIRGKPEKTSEDYDEIIPKLPIQKMEKSIMPKTKEEDYEQVAQKLPPQKIIKMQEIPSEFKEASIKVKRTEPVFIRLDKFEESLEIFEKIKERIMDIEKMLKETQEIKDIEVKEIEIKKKYSDDIERQLEEIQKKLLTLQ